MVHNLVETGEDSAAGLEMLLDALGGAHAPRLQQRIDASERRPASSTRQHRLRAGGGLPENAILVDESLTTGRETMGLTAGAAPHDVLQNMGGSIGFSTPVATGAALACPDRRVFCMVGDGSAMYTIQSLWTQARESAERDHHHLRQPLVPDPQGRVRQHGLRRAGPAGAGDDRHRPAAHRLARHGRSMGVPP
jgi:acetolactate synthase-1/2/3 large subunit